VALPSRTFETRADAQNYARIMDGKVSGNEYVVANRAAARAQFRKRSTLGLS